MILALVVSSFLLAAVSSQEILSNCPSPNGFFADAAQCDKYYQCVDNVLTEKICPDGMAFNDLNPRVEKCDFLFQVNCDGRPDLQRPKSTVNCPRQNGYFPHQDPTNCMEFFYCTTGISSKLTCPETLSFSTKTGTCVWPKQSGRVECKTENQNNFTCPNTGLGQAGNHPRFSDPEDCQYFYVCIDGTDPRRNGCAFGHVFDSKTLTCSDPKDVPDCADYYTEHFDNYFATLAGRASGNILSAALASGYPIPEFRDRVRIQPGAKAPTQRGTTESPVSERPLRRRRPGVNGANRPLRRRKTTTSSTTTTTTTTTTPPPEYYDYYYDEYYDDPVNTTTTTTTAPANRK